MKVRAVLCDECKLMIRPVVSAKLAITRTYDIKVFALGAYEEPLQSLIRAKHHGDRIASRDLAKLFCSTGMLDAVPCDYWVPIPLHWTRFASRGFNQATEMAAIFSQESGKPVAELLKRNKRTKFQALLSPQARLSNVKEAFSLHKQNMEQYRDKHLILVDDLMTTGSTLQEAVRALRMVQPASITAVVFCRVV